MTHHNLPRILCVKVHRTTEAVLKHLAVSALTRFHPLTVTEGLETVFPNVQEITVITGKNTGKKQLQNLAHQEKNVLKNLLNV